MRDEDDNNNNDSLRVKICEKAKTKAVCRSRR